MAKRVLRLRGRTLGAFAGLLEQLLDDVGVRLRSARGASAPVCHAIRTQSAPARPHLRPEDAAAAALPEVDHVTHEVHGFALGFAEEVQKGLSLAPRRALARKARGQARQLMRRSAAPRALEGAAAVRTGAASLRRARGARRAEHAHVQTSKRIIAVCAQRSSCARGAAAAYARGHTQGAGRR